MEKSVGSCNLDNGDNHFLFSHESPQSNVGSYPSIPLPVAYYINQNCPEIVEKATMRLFESRSNTPNTSSRSTESSDSSQQASPLRSMATASEGLSLPQSFIGSPVVPNGTGVFSYSNYGGLRPGFKKSDILEIEKDVLEKSKEKVSSVSSITATSPAFPRLLPTTPDENKEVQLVGTHCSLSVGEEMLKNLEMQRTIPDSKRDSRSDGGDALSNSSEAFETESVLSSVSGIEDEFVEIKQLMTKVPLLAQSHPCGVFRSKLRNGVQVFTQTEPSAGEPEAKLHFETLRQKVNLEEQISALKEEFQILLKEKLKLSETINSTEAQMKSLTLTFFQSSQEKERLENELKNMTRQSHQWENVIGDYQDIIDTKTNDIKALKEDLANLEVQNEKLKVHLSEEKVDMSAKDGAIRGLKQKITELHVQVQNLISDKIHLENDISSLKSEKVTVQKSKEWYVEQLHAVQETKNEMHRDFIRLQADYSGTFIQLEQTKSENAQLRQRLQESQFKMVKEKEVLMKHLENIEADMLEREAIFQQIERDKGSAEEMIAIRMKKLEEEQSALSNNKLRTSDLEYNYQATLRANQDLLKNFKDLQAEKSVLLMETASMRRKHAEQDMGINELQHEKKALEKLLNHTESQLKLEEQKCTDLIREKTTSEISLAAATAEKKEVNEALKVLQENLMALEGNFKHMHAELVNKTSKLSQLMNENQRLEESIQQLEKQLLQQRLTFQEQTSKEHQNSHVHIDDLKKQNLELEKVISALKKELRQWEDETTSLKDRNVSQAENVIQLQREVLSLQKSEKGAQEERQHAVRQNYEPEVYKLQSLMEENELHFKNRIRVYESNIKVLTRKLKQVMKESKDKSSILAQLGSCQSQMAIGVQTEETSPLGVENSLTDVEKMIEKYKEQVEKLEGQVKDSNKARDQLESALEHMKLNILELEKENGQMKGTFGRQDSLREEMSKMAEALMEKELKVVALLGELEETRQSAEAKAKKLKDKCSLVELEISKEKTKCKELRYQIFQDKRELKQTVNRVNSLSTQIEQKDRELEENNGEVNRLRLELERMYEERLKGQSELLQLQKEVKEGHLRAKLLQEELGDFKSRDPALAQQMKTLSWHLKEKNQEIAGLKKQLEVMGERCLAEKDGLNNELQERFEEMKDLKLELATTRREKFSLQSSLSEFKGALRSSICANKGMTETKGDKSLKDATSHLSRPSYDESYINSLLQKSLALPEGRPLSNLQACLNSLKEEMSVLHKELEKRTQS